jgi:hypothetical protein
LEKFETVLGLKPEAREEAVASYNVACCYSQLKQVKFVSFASLKYEIQDSPGVTTSAQKCLCLGVLMILLIMVLKLLHRNLFGLCGHHE